MRGVTHNLYKLLLVPIHFQCGIPNTPPQDGDSFRSLILGRIPTIGSDTRLGLMGSDTMKAERNQVPGIISLLEYSEFINTSRRYQQAKQ